MSLNLEPPPFAPSARNVERRAEIVRRAAEIFDRQGVSRTSLENIAAAIGVKREAVYYYYRDKSEILCEIIRPHSEALLRGMERFNALGLSATARLSLAISGHLERFNPTYVEMTVALRELSGSNPAPGIVELRRVWKEYEQHWIELFRQGQAAGEFDDAQNPKLMAFAVLGMCNAVSGWYRPDGGIAMDELVRSYTAIALGGVARFKDDAVSQASFARKTRAKKEKAQ
jgi:AcrR family transcriptional regulator